MATYKVYPPLDPNKETSWIVVGEMERDILKVDSVLILKDCEAICERIDNRVECYILVTGARREKHRNMVVLEKLA